MLSFIIFFYQSIKRLYTIQVSRHASIQVLVRIFLQNVLSKVVSRSRSIYDGTPPLLNNSVKIRRVRMCHRNFSTF